MKSSESIPEMYTRFTQIVTYLHALGRELINYEKVNKILRCLPSFFDAKITAVTESKDLSTYSIDNLYGSLIAYEQGVNQRNLDAGEKKKEKNVALKANDTDFDSSEFESDDVALITRQFKSFLRKKQKNHQKWNKGKEKKNLKFLMIWFALNAGSQDMLKLISLHLSITQARRRARRNPSSGRTRKDSKRYSRRILHRIHLRLNLKRRQQTCA
ncbi:hypothetical protein MA16_Dca015734 [Dendrobium catenatum]|uniref:Retrovirus-related Pol polyprotein from transposon TNT 1-94 n=1 Tax=Dendrobium catenatum TaxID=906689 RepID=A0A2I0WHV3_9ASPA|nr:hypothetical protein MA16_Dca015734 [Dendrobium catenatum]